MMILTNLCIFCLSPIKWITLYLIVLFNKISILSRLKEIIKKNKITPVMKDVEIHPNFVYCFKFYEFNVVKMENSKRNRRNLRFKLAFERFILIIMIIKKFNCIYHTTKWLLFVSWWHDLSIRWTTNWQTGWYISLYNFLFNGFILFQSKSKSFKHNQFDESLQ